MEGPSIKMEMVAATEVPARHNGRNTLRRIPTTTIEPGGHLFYTINVVNEGDGPALNLVVDNPVPNGAIYVPGSARGAESTVRISVDGGESWVPEQNSVLPETVTHVRWLISRLPAGQTRKLEFEILAVSAEATRLARMWTGLYSWLLGNLSR